MRERFSINCIQSQKVRHLASKTLLFAQSLCTARFWRASGRCNCRFPATRHTTGLQIKRSLTISSAASNGDFREIIRGSLNTLEKADFRDG
jgi:hypothetical protein